jgi:GT2 family glycosyltransferase
MLLRAAALAEVGLFDEEYFFFVEDLDLCLRLRAAGWEVIVDPGARARHLGSATIGATSPRRLYFAARNHLRLGLRTAPRHGMLLRQANIAALHIAHALLRAPGARGAALVAVARGIGDHLRRRYGPDATAAARRRSP